MFALLKSVRDYILAIFTDVDDLPSCKRYMCVTFGIAAVVFASLGYGVEIVGCFVSAALAENITSVFERKDV
jgi:hypothetical protein